MSSHYFVFFCISISLQIMRCKVRVCNLANLFHRPIYMIRHSWLLALGVELELVRLLAAGIPFVVIDVAASAAVGLVRRMHIQSTMLLRSVDRQNANEIYHSDWILNHHTFSMQSPETAFQYIFAENEFTSSFDCSFLSTSDNLNE